MAKRKLKFQPWKAYRGPSKQEILAKIREQEQIEDFYTNLGAY